MKLPMKSPVKGKARFHLLHAGYVRDDHVAGTVSLIIDGDARLVVDPGMVPSTEAILGPLREHGVEPASVTHVLLTHHHPDHTLNVGLFPNAQVVDLWAGYRDDLWMDHDADGYRPTPNVRLLATPGHTDVDVTWLVETDGGVIACTHAWWFADRTPEVDPFAPSQDQLQDSRRRILAEATRVVPGHGEPFEVPRGKRRG
jgi:glyoxylase-like metal-dependent hydrolase (beta-lactamase superfamily II)